MHFISTVRAHALLLLALVLLAGCSLNGSARSPYEWISLANSGLSGTDDYSYSAQIETGIQNNIKMNVTNYTGEVHSHQEYTISGEEVDSTLLHPSKYMDIMNKPENTFSLLQQPLDANATEHTLKFLVEESNNDATLRWKTLLLQQLDQVKLSTEHMKSAASSEKQAAIAQLFTQTETEMQQILDTLQVDSQFTVTIDRVNAIPLLIEEYAVLNYLREGKPFNEYRKLSVHLQY